jgi:hypothetical protein
MRIKAPRDFWSGVMFVGLAVLAFVTSQGYALGTSTRMGPGYFPVVLSLVLGALGLVLVARSLVLSGEALEPFHGRAVGVLVLAIVAFGLMIGKLGLVVSLGLVTAFSALASAQFRVLEVLALSVSVTVFSVLVFVVALRLPLSVWPSF